MRAFRMLLRGKSWPSEAEVVQRLKEENNFDADKYKRYRRQVFVNRALISVFLIILGTIVYIVVPNSEKWIAKAIAFVVFVLVAAYHENSLQFYVYNSGLALKAKLRDIRIRFLPWVLTHEYKFMFDGQIFTGKLRPLPEDIVEDNSIYMAYMPEDPVFHAPLVKERYFLLNVTKRDEIVIDG